MSHAPEAVYIAGPMTGYKDYNYPAFFAKEEVLLYRGYEVFNPARNCGDTLEEAIASAKQAEGIKVFADFFRPDLMMLSKADAICMLPEWQQSKRGAPLEYAIGRAMDLPIYIDNGTRLVPIYSIVGVSGYARAGKDTIAQALVEEKGYTRLAFADIVRDALYALNPWVFTYNTGVGYERLRDLVDDIGWDEAKAQYPEIRQLQQRMGGDSGRGVIGTDIWVNAALRKMEDGGKYVFSDMRYPNEADAVKRLGGQTLRVEREGVGPVNDHESEIALDDYTFDRRLYNYSSIGAIRDQALAVVR